MPQGPWAAPSRQPLAKLVATQRRWGHIHPPARARPGQAAPDRGEGAHLGEGRGQGYGRARSPAQMAAWTHTVPEAAPLHMLAKGRAQGKDNIAVRGPSATKPYG